MESARTSPNMCRLLMDHGAQTELAITVYDLIAMIILGKFPEHLEV